MKTTELIDWVVVLHPTWQKMGHFGDVPQANLLAWYGKTKPNNKSTHSPIKRNVRQNKINTKKLKPGIVSSYDTRPANRKGVFWFRHFKNLSLTYLLTYLDNYPLTYSPRPTPGENHRSSCKKSKKKCMPQQKKTNCKHRKIFCH